MAINAAALLLMGLFASIGSLFLKKAAEGGLSPLALLSTRWFYLGGLLYAASALMNLYLLRLLPYSLVVPLGALTYVWTLFISNRVLGERITRRKIAGICLILCKVAALAIF